MYTVYCYDLDNTSGRWKMMSQEVLVCYELWCMNMPKDAIVGVFPEDWKQYPIVYGDSPERRFT